MNLAPIVIFAYNRLWHLEKTIESLQKNPLAAQSNLFVYSDGAKSEKDQKKVQAIRAYLKTIKGFSEILIIESIENQGLAKSVITGVSNVLNQYSSVIVMEDDMICASNFLNFMNDTLQFYQDNPKIFSISGYTFPIEIPQDYPYDVFIHPRASSWGWATWQNRWEKTDWQIADYQEFINSKFQQKCFNQGGYDLSLMLKKQQLGLVDSWAIRWTYTHFKNEAYCLYPVKSKIQNIGTDSSGIHSPKTKKYQVNLEITGYQLVTDLEINQTILQKLAIFFKPSWIRRIINYWKFGM